MALKIPLFDFESYIEDYLLNRGYSYYIKKRITKVIESPERTYFAIVAGSYEYQVEVKLNSINTIIK